MRPSGSVSSLCTQQTKRKRMGKSREGELHVEAFLHTSDGSRPALSLATVPSAPALWGPSLCGPPLLFQKRRLLTTCSASRERDVDTARTHAVPIALMGNYHEVLRNQLRPIEEAHSNGFSSRLLFSTRLRWYRIRSGVRCSLAIRLQWLEPTRRARWPI